MAATALILGLLLASHFIQWVAWGICLTIGLKWARTENITSRGVVATTVATHVAQIILLAVLALIFYLGRHWPQSVLAVLAASGLIGMALIPILLVRSIFQIPFWRSIQSLIPTLLVLAIGYTLVAGVMQPFLPRSAIAAATEHVFHKAR